MTEEERTQKAGSAEERLAELRARRALQASRRRRLRRRGGAALALLAAGGGLLAVLMLSGPGSGGQRPRALAHRSRQRSGSEGRVRNSVPQPGWRPYTGPVPILEYHVLGAPPAQAPYPELYVTRSDFQRQLDWLDSHGYQAVTLEQVQRAWYHGGRLPPKPVVISFDDGYRPQFTYALPELRKHGWAGVLNLKAEGSDLYHSNVEAMIHAGWELAAHTIHHLDLTELDAARLREEVAGSRSMLRREYGVPVNNFCYPSGRFDATVIAAVKAAGYVGATTEIPGYASRARPFELSRFEILGSSGVTGLAADLRSGPG